MDPLLILALVLAGLWLISRIRVGALVDYSAAGLVVKLRLGPFSPTLYPVRKKERKKEKRPKPPKPPKPIPEPAKNHRKGGALDLARRFLPLVAEAAGRLRRKIRIDDLDLDLTVAAPDPAMAAMAYGGSNAILGMFTALLEHNFHVRRSRVRTTVDFTAAAPAVAILAAATLTIGQGLALTLILVCKALKILLAYRKQTSMKQKEAV